MQRQGAVVEDNEERRFRREPHELHQGDQAASRIVQLGVEVLHHSEELDELAHGLVRVRVRELPGFLEQLALLFPPDLRDLLLRFVL